MTLGPVALSDFQAFGGEVNDIDYETQSAFVGAVSVTRDTTRAQTGSACLKFDLSANGNKAIVNVARIATGTPRVLAISGAVGLDAAPSSAAALVYGTTSTPASGGTNYVQINTDRTLRINDKNGTQIGSNTSNTIPTSGLRELLIVWDGLTHSTVWIHVGFDGVWEWSYNTGLTWANYWDASNIVLFWGEYLAGGTNRGCSYYIDDGCGAASTTATDAPHLAQVPRYRVGVARAPDGDGASTAWTDELGGTAGFASVDDAGPNDGVTLPGGTWWQSTTVDQKQLAKRSGANNLPNPCTPDWVQGRHVGALTGGGKAQSLFLIRLGGSEVTTSPGHGWSTSPVGVCAAVMARPGGGSWARGDFDSNTLEFGVQSPSSSAGNKVTMLYDPDVIYHESSWPLAPTPWSIFLHRNRAPLVPFPEGPNPAQMPKHYQGLFAQPAVAGTTQHQRGWVI